MMITSKTGNRDGTLIHTKGIFSQEETEGMEQESTQRRGGAKTQTLQKGRFQERREVGDFGGLGNKPHAMSSPGVYSFCSQSLQEL
jgi:hypothetical protein